MAIFIKISISKSANLTILSDGSASITTVKKKKSSSSTSVIEVGGEMIMKMAHVHASSMTKYNEVKSRTKIITDDRLTGQDREGSPHLRAYLCQDRQGGESQNHVLGEVK